LVAALRTHPIYRQLMRVWRLSGRWLPQGWLDAIRQLALFAGAYYVYRLVRGFVDGQAGLAFENARTLVDIERSLGLFFEPGLQAWAKGEEWLLWFANWMYVNSHFVVTTTFLIWLYIARNHAYYFVRNMFLVAMGLALVGYLAYPTAPPRFLPEWGFSDTVASFVGETAEQSANVLYNPFAAVPSMHVAFALMIAVPAFVLVRNRVLKALWAVYPLVVTFVVMVTANHYWLDAALGALVAAFSAYAAGAAFARARPEAWAFRTAGAKAPA
jgi:membrane-associated phospholipid phosphatase